MFVRSNNVVQIINIVSCGRTSASGQNAMYLKALFYILTSGLHVSLVCCFSFSLSGLLRL